MRTCAVCKTLQDTRPYGENGAEICFPCMMASPEREAVAQRQFAARLGPGVNILTDRGPVPVDPKVKS